MADLNIAELLQEMLARLTALEPLLLEEQNLLSQWPIPWSELERLLVNRCDLIAHLQAIEQKRLAVLAQHQIDSKNPVEVIQWMQQASLGEQWQQIESRTRSCSLQLQTLSAFHKEIQRIFSRFYAEFLGNRLAPTLYNQLGKLLT